MIRDRPVHAPNGTKPAGTCTSSGVSGSLTRGTLAGNLTLLKNDGRTEKNSDDAEGGERNQRNHQDGHKSLLYCILEPGLCAGGDDDHGPL